MPWCASGLEAERLLCPELAEESSLVARIPVLFSNVDSFSMQFPPIQYGVYVGPRRADRRIWNFQKIFEYDDKKGLFLVRLRSSRDGKWFCAVL